MASPLEELIRKGDEIHAHLIATNNEIDRAFCSGTLGDLINSWRDKNDRDTGELAGETGADVVGDQAGGEGGEPEAVS